MSSERGGSGGPSKGPPKACPSCAARYPADALFCPLDGAPLTTSPAVIAVAAVTDPYVGREIQGHIEIRQLVGIGAMGRVYRAFQRGIDRDVAVKILHRELSSNQVLVARFEREAKVASRLAHPNVVHVLLVGQLPDGSMYIVMEYLDGLSLQSALAGVDGALPLPRALHIALQLCDAAGEGHGVGIVHRDLKPENVMLVRRADDPDFVKVLDFGIARVQLGDQSIATAAGLIFGTARYISPEGAQGEKVGPQGDVYAIATILYQMLSGRTPFQGDQAVGILISQIHDPPPPLTGLARAAYVPEAIAAVIMQNLSKRPDERAPSGRALGRALLDAAVASGLSAHDVLARPSLLGGGRASYPGAVQMPPLQRTRQLQLEPETLARMGSPTAFETPAPAAVEGPAPEGRAPLRTEIADEPAQAQPERARLLPTTPLPPGVATTRWVPPDGFAAKLLTPQATPGSTPSPPPVFSPAPRPGLAFASGVDATMDEQQSVSSRTLPTLPTLPTRTVVPATDPGDSGRASQAGPPEKPKTAPPTSRPWRTPPPASKPPSGVDTTLAGDESPLPRVPRTSGRRGTASPAALAALFALLGGLALGGVAWRAGYLAFAGTSSGHGAGVHPDPSPPDLNAASAGASRTGATAANEPGNGGDTAGALPPLEPLARTSPQARTGAAAPGAARGPAAGGGSAAGPQGAPAGAWRVVVDASAAKPGLGQPVDFTARIEGASGSRSRPRVDDGRFLIAGPGIAGGTELPAPGDGSGVFRTTFTFLQGGHFDVAFTGHADGAPVRGGRVVVVGDDSTAANALPRSSVPAAPAAPAPAMPPAPAAPVTEAPVPGAAGGKWL